MPVQPENDMLAHTGAESGGNMYRLRIQMIKN